MSYCINPRCNKPNDPSNANNPICRNCGSDLFIKGRYQVMRLLSDKSGFGKIYEAYEGAAAKILKVLKEDYSTNPKVVELFQQEAAVLIQLNHPSVPKVEPEGYFQFFPKNASQPLHCIIMEKIEGPNLKQWMKQQGNHPISEKQALNWLKQLAEILHLIHQKNYFHRDIKPENIMLRPSGQLVLIDFGTAREMTYTYLSAVSGEGSVTRISSAGYTPPEQQKGHAVPQSDFYALGRTFVYLLTGKELTHDIYDALNDEFNWRNYAPNISPQFADFIDKLIANKAVARPKNTQELLDTIVNLLGGLPQVQLSLNLLDANTPTRTIAKMALAPTKIQKTHKKLLAGGAVALVLGLGGYGIWQFNDVSPPPKVAATANISTKTISNKSFVNSLVFSPDGQQLFSGSADKTIKIWNLANEEIIGTLEGHKSYVNSLAISPDGQKLFSGSADKTIKIWNLTTGKVTNTLTGHSGFVNSVAIRPDGAIIASGSADKTIKIWNPTTGELIRTFKGHSGFINSVAISPDGEILASGSADKTIKIWNLTKGKVTHTLTDHKSYVKSVAISRDGQILVSGGADKTIRIWNLSTGKLIHTLTAHKSEVNSVAISHDGQILVSGGSDKTIRIWNLATRELINTLKGHSNDVNSLVLSGDRQTIASGSGDKTIKIWQMPP